jgi:serine/threonine protein kinase
MKVLAENGPGKAKFKVPEESFESEFKREVKFLKTLNHPHIVKMVHHKVGDEDEERPKSGESRKSNKSSGSERGEEDSNGLKTEFKRYIVLDYAENGDLFDFTIAI